jgi:hypothetical protein
MDADLAYLLIESYALVIMTSPLILIVALSKKQTDVNVNKYLSLRKHDYTKLEKRKCCFILIYVDKYSLCFL